MDTTQILPNIGSPVSSPAFDEAAAADMSIGEAAYAATYFAKLYAQKLADPGAADEVARFITASGADWSGLQSNAPDQDSASQAQTEEDTPADESMVAVVDQDGHQRQGYAPAPPDNYYDTLPAMAHMLRQQRAAMDAAVTHFAAQVDAVMEDQPSMLGVPEGIKAYRDGAAYFRDVLKISSAQTTKIFARVPYVTWTPGKDPTLIAYQPSMPAMAESFADGKISGENLDRMVGLDQDLTKYVHKTKAAPEAKAEALAIFEPALVDAAETATPDELSKERSRWAEMIAHALDPDGPPVAEAIRKQANNAIRTQNMADGTGKVSVHLTASLYALFKNWSLHQLNGNGTQVTIDPDLIDLLKAETDDQDEQPTGTGTAGANGENTTDHHAPDDATDGDHGSEPQAASTFSDLNDLNSQPHPDAQAEDGHGNTISAKEAAGIDQLSTGQRLTAILAGMFHTISTMDPTELGAKSAHGTSAQLMIVQDIQTAYETLGVGALPEAVRRPPGPTGLLPPIISQPNPDDPATPACENPDHTRGHSPPSWTQYMSEAINIGAFQPKHAEPLACDSKLVGQIWNGHHDVLAQHRTKRLFTPAQRRAILARDRGCQAPGCTVPAIYCQVHHIVEWLNGGTTDVDNAITVCALHHAAIHNNKWTIRKHHGATFFQPAPWLDPYQPLLRNRYWNV